MALEELGVLPMRTIVLTLCFVLICPYANAQESSKAADAARSFGYKGIVLGSTNQEFRRVFPREVILESESSVGDTHAIVFVESDRFIFFDFFDGRVYRIKKTVGRSTALRADGIRDFDRTMLDRFGTPDESLDFRTDLVIHNWILDGGRIHVKYEKFRSSAGYVAADVTVIDSDLEAELKAYQAKIGDLGF
jgi:hypothetical protein